VRHPARKTSFRSWTVAARATTTGPCGMFAGGSGVFGEEAARAFVEHDQGRSVRSHATPRRIFLNRHSYDAVDAVDVVTYRYRVDEGQPLQASDGRHATACRHTCRRPQDSGLPRGTGLWWQAVHIEALNHAVVINEVKPIAVHCGRRAHAQSLGKMRKFMAWPASRRERRPFRAVGKAHQQVTRIRKPQIVDSSSA